MCLTQSSCGSVIMIMSDEADKENIGFLVGRSGRITGFCDWEAAFSRGCVGDTRSPFPDRNTSSTGSRHLEVPGGKRINWPSSAPAVAHQLSVRDRRPAPTKATPRRTSQDERTDFLFQLTRNPRPRMLGKFRLPRIADTIAAIVAPDAEWGRWR